MPRITPNRATRLTLRCSTAAFAPLIMIALLVLLAACDATSTAGSTPPTDTTAPVATATATTASSTPAAGNAVDIEDFDFSPSSLTVKAGTTVTWTNTTSATPHTVTSDTGLFDRGVGPNSAFPFKFTQAGVFHYHCKVHPTMMGTITVTAS
jgi:plastocyanin